MAHCHRSGIGSVHGKLRLWQFYVMEEAGCFVVKVWELDSDGWVTVHDARPRTEHCPFSIHAVLRALHPCDGDMVFLLEPSSRNVWQYHIRRGSCEKICEFKHNCTSGHIYALVHLPWPTMIPGAQRVSRLSRA